MRCTQTLLLLFPLVLFLGAVLLALPGTSMTPTPLSRQVVVEYSRALSSEESTAPPEEASTAPPDDEGTTSTGNATTPQSPEVSSSTTTTSTATTTVATTGVVTTTDSSKPDTAPCAEPTSAHGTFSATGDAEGATGWTLTCTPGFRPDPRIGSSFFCAAGLDDLPTPVCVADQGCSGSDAIPTGASALGTTCASVLAEGETCAADCDLPALSYGEFVCSSGEMLHTSHCVAPEDSVTTEVVRKVAATIAVELDQQPTDADGKNAISAALDIPTESVHSVRWLATRQSLAGFLGGAQRRLQTAYALSYEVIVPADASPDAVLQRASELAVDGSGAGHAFKASLHSSGIAAGAAQHVVAPRSFQQTVVKSSEGVVLPMQGATTTTNSATTSFRPKSNEDSSSSVVGPLIGGVLGFLLGLGIISLMLYALWSNFQKQQCKKEVVATSIVPVAWEGRDRVVAGVEEQKLDLKQNDCCADQEQDEVVAAAMAPIAGERQQCTTVVASSSAFKS